LKCAYELGQYNFYWVCSGQDFPIKPVDQIVEKFAANINKNFVNLFESQNFKGEFNHYDKRNSIYYPGFLFGRSAEKRIMKRAYVEITGGYNRTFTWFQRKNVTGLVFYFGANWMALNRDIVTWMFQYMKSHPEYTAFFHHCQNPDESFFHTLFMNSPYRETREDFLHYVDWSEGGNSPKVLTINDYERLKHSQLLMARKFDADVDSTVIEKLREDEQS